MGTKKVSIEYIQNEWDIAVKGGGSGGPGAYPKIYLGRNDGPDLIVFTIKNPDITFSNDPIWVAQGAKPQPGSQHDQLPYKKVMDNGKKLVVFDLNDNPQKMDLHYQLNFAGNVESLDPIIDNGGGGFTDPGFIGAIVENAGLLLLASLVFFTLGMWVRKLRFT
jgi:hypothetical protein